jgi:glycosyltransferase involved in cell wall biosynthesis
MPKVSIITPFYNIPDYETYQRTAISIESQGNKDFEWILVDDGSDKHDWKSTIRLERNYGPSVARNIGFQVSKGDIVTYVDMGDELSPYRVQSIIKQFQDYDIDILFSAYYINQYNHSYPVNHLEIIGSRPSIPDAHEYLKVLQRANIAIPLGVAHKRYPFIKTGGFQPGIVCGEDGVLWRRMCDLVPGHRIMFSDEIAGTYFVSQVGQSRTQRRFEMGGFAINGSLNDNGRYLDDSWYSKFTSEDWYE